MNMEEPFVVDTDTVFAVIVLPNIVENPPHPSIILDIMAVDVVTLLPANVDATSPLMDRVDPVTVENRTVLPPSVE